MIYSSYNFLNVKLNFNEKVNGPYLLPELELLIFTRYLASGSFMHVAGDLCGIGLTSSFRAIHRMINHFAKNRRRFIRFPSTHELERISLKFREKKGFPKVIGCVDGTHIEVKVPKNDVSETFRNRKGRMTLNVQMVCGPNELIYDIVASWPGSAHDSAIWTSCLLRSQFESGIFPNEYHLLGDSAYPLTEYMMTPIRNATITRESIF